LALCEDAVDRTGLTELLQRACRREPVALTELIERYSPRVFGLLFRLTRSRDAAEDLLQETFLRVVRTIENYEHTGRFEPWLFRIAANLARDRARRHVRRGERTSVDAAWMDELPQATAPDADSATNPLERMERGEARERLQAALDQLSAPEREIVLLRHYSELSFREIADLLGVPLGTALARAHRALKHLRTHLTDAE
jgi:RNA polymerase sigma-70 factor (ECF subfamily)